MRPIFIRTNFLRNGKLEYGEQKMKTSTKMFRFIQHIVQGDVLCQLLVFIEENVNFEYYGTFVEYSFVPVFQGPGYLH